MERLDRTHADAVHGYVARFLADPALVVRTATVLATLPDEVRADFMNDPCFQIALDVFVEGRGRRVWLAGPLGADWRGSRCVVLKGRLAHCAEDFAHWVIAHEFAHAHLWNGGWGDITDREEAADALAAHWGFPRPAAARW